MAAIPHTHERDDDPAGKNRQANRVSQVLVIDCGNGPRKLQDQQRDKVAGHTVDN